MSEQQMTESVHAVVYPFAELQEAPSWVSPKDGDYMALQTLFEASDHADFVPHNAHDYRGNFPEPTHCLRLPMQLALGLHPASRHGIDNTLLTQVFKTYTSVHGIGGLEGGEKVERRVQRDKAEHILAATIVNYAIDSHSLNLNFRPDSITRAIDASRDTGLVSRHRARRIAQAVKLVQL